MIMLSVAGGILLAGLIIAACGAGLQLIQQDNAGYGLDGNVGWWLVALSGMAGAAIIVSQII